MAAMGVALPFPWIFPNPDGAIDTYEDRAHSIGLYRLPDTDTTPPVFSSGPSVGTVTPTSIQVTFAATDDLPPIDFYVVAVADAATAPSAAQIKAGTDALDAPAPNANTQIANSGDSGSVSVTGLTASTAYDLYYVASDFSANDTTPAKLDQTTIAESAASASNVVAIRLIRKQHG